MNPGVGSVDRQGQNPQKPSSDWCTNTAAFVPEPTTAPLSVAPPGPA